MTENEKKDYQRFYVVETEAGFSPERNKFVVENSIKKYEARRKKMEAQFEDNLRERTSAVVDYLFYRDRGGTKDVEGYFGKKMLSYLRGAKIVSMLRPGNKGLILTSN